MARRCSCARPAAHVELGGEGGYQRGGFDATNCAHINKGMMHYYAKGERNFRRQWHALEIMAVSCRTVKLERARLISWHWRD